MVLNKVKTKITLGALGIIVFTMTLSSVIVSFIIYGQNREASFNLLKQTMSIVRDDITALKRKLLTISHQAATANDMGANLEFASSMSYEKGEGLGLEGTFQTMTSGLYNISTTANIWKAAIYKVDGSLAGFVVIDNDRSLVGFPRTNDFLAANLKKGEKITSESWKALADFSGFDSIHQGAIPDTDVIHYAGAGRDMVLKAMVPVMATVINNETFNEEIKQVGFIVSIYRFDALFTERLSKITGNRIGIVMTDGTILGDLTGYHPPTPDLFAPVSENWNLNDQAIILNEITLEEDGYFQGLLPVYSKTDRLSAIIALYSKDKAMGNTWFVIKVLSLVSAGIMVVLIPLAYLFSRSFSKPLEELSRVLSEVENTCDFTRRVRVRSQDEVGQTSLAFNNLMDSLQEAMTNINQVLRAVAKGDLSLNITNEYKGELNDLKTYVNESVEMLSQMISHVMSASKQVNSGARELTTSSQNLASGTSRQAATLQQISSSMSEIERRTKDNKSSATKTQALTNETIDVVGNGNQEMESMLQSMERINHSSSEVAKVIKAIDEIAFQTNLLALNAAVEAARAGKYGKGFAVVAEEVRNLAGRSAEAAKDTTSLIEASLKEVENGVQKAKSTAAVFEKISLVVEQSSTLVNEISASSIEQASSVGQINQGLSQVNEVIQENSSISEESASASEELSGQASQLQEMMNMFKLTGGFTEGQETVQLALPG